MAIKNQAAFLVILTTLTSCSTGKSIPTARGPASSSPDQAVAETSGAQHVPIFVLGGDEASLTPPAAGEAVEDTAHYDVIVVGSGLAGLSAAVYMSDKHLKVLVLEKEDNFGGLASAGTNDGIMYDRGAAYWTSPFPEEAAILKHIGLGNYEKKYPIPEPIDNYYWNGKLYVGIWDPKTLLELPASFALFKRELEIAQDNNQIPDQPMEEFEKLGGKMDLDKLDTAKWIRSMPTMAKTRTDAESKAIYARFDRDVTSGKIDSSDPMSGVIGLMDLYCRSALGTTSEQVSAMAFANFYISEIVTRYTTSIGTAQAAVNMLKMLKMRRHVTLLSGAPVAKIVPGDINQVTYLLHSDLKSPLHRAKAKYIVYAAQLRSAPQIIEGFADGSPQQAQIMSDMGYSHYSVHNIEVKGHPYRLSYDTWTRANDYTENDFTDFILGRWVELKGYEGFRDFSADPQGNSVLTIYDPLALKWIGTGYTRDQAAQIADRAVNRLMQLYQPVFHSLNPGSAKDPSKSEIHLMSVKTSRWPFSVHIAKPGHFIHEARILRKPYGNIFFANNNMGTPAFEEALFRGHCAAVNVLYRTSPSYQKEAFSRCPIDQ